jgi:hypothetical protein
MTSCILRAMSPVEPREFLACPDASPHTRWLVVRTQHRQALEYREIWSGSGQRTALADELSRRAAEGWRLRELAHDGTACFAERQHERILVGTSVVSPGPFTPQTREVPMRDSAGALRASGPFAQGRGSRLARPKAVATFEQSEFLHAKCDAAHADLTSSRRHFIAMEQCVRISRCKASRREAYAGEPAVRRRIIMSQRTHHGPYGCARALGLSYSNVRLHLNRPHRSAGARPD